MTDVPTPTSQIERHSFEVVIQIDAPLETTDQVRHRLANVFRGTGMAVAVMSIVETAAEEPPAVTQAAKKAPATRARRASP